jgi:hypothetical protein
MSMSSTKISVYSLPALKLVLEHTYSYFLKLPRFYSGETQVQAKLAPALAMKDYLHHLFPNIGQHSSL